MENTKRRVNICLNLNDPVQRYSFQVIATKGRKKSEYVAAAVKYYTEMAGNVESGTPLPVKQSQLPSGDHLEPDPNDADLSDMLDSINNFF